MAGMKSIRLECILLTVMSAALFIGEVQQLRRETDPTISIFSSVIGKHMFDGSPNA
jgi:hypothetical protein